MKRRYEIALVLLIVAIAAFFRFHNLDTTPPGLYPDEAMNGSNALQAIETGPPAGGYKVFYPENNGREGLFINIQAMSIKLFGNTPWSLRVVSALIGTLTVLGLYLLARQMFNWQIAAFSSFLMAVSFWHVNFSRIGFRAIMAPLFLTWGFYFFWRALATGSPLTFLASGLVFGLGFHTYIAYRILPFMLVAILIGYLQSIHRDFSHEKYLATRKRIWLGIAVCAIAAFVAAAPLLNYFADHPEDFVGRSNKTSVLNDDNPVYSILSNGIKTLGMFTFVGDHNWRHNIDGSPTLFWLVGVLFAAGLLSSWVKLIRILRNHGHISSSQLFLQTWFFIGLAPTVLSNEGLPHSLRAIIITPVVFIFAGKGLWWLFETLESWYHTQDMHRLDVRLPHHRQVYFRESMGISLTALVILLGAITAVEYHRYFNLWANDPNTANEFTQRYVDIARQLNDGTIKTPVYILVNAGDVMVDGVSVHAQTIKYLTRTYSSEQQRAKNIYYLSQDDYDAGKYPRDAKIIRLKE